MGDEITVPAYARPRLSLRAIMKARAHPAPSLPSPPSDETESVDSHCSSSTTSSSAQYHAPILTGELSFDNMDAERSQQSLAMDIAFGMEIPRIMVTLPSSDELTEDNNRYPSRDSPWRNAGLWDGEPDEVRWVEEYGQWNTQVKRKRGDTSDAWSDSDSDTSSIASSLFITVPDTSSLTTSPPSSPVGYLDSPSTYDTHVRPSHSHSSLTLIPPFSQSLCGSSSYPPRSSSLSRSRSLSSISSHPALWLCHIVSKPFSEHKRRRIQKLKKKPSSAHITSSYVPLPSSPHVRVDSSHTATRSVSIEAPDSPQPSAFSDARFSELTGMGEHPNVSSWSVDSQDLRRGWGTLGRLFKRSRT